MSSFLAAQPWQGAVAMLFVGAALALAIPHARTSWAAALVVLGAAAVFVIDLSLRGVAPHAADGVSIFAGPLIATLAALSALAGGGALRELSAAVAPFAMALALCAAGGWVFALMAADWIAFALAAELAWLAGAGLVAAADARRGALNGALRMIAIGGASAALMLVGAAFVMRGSESAEIAALGGASKVSLCIAGLVLVLLSLAVKAGLAPLHA